MNPATSLGEKFYSRWECCWYLVAIWINRPWKIFGLFKRNIQRFQSFIATETGDKNRPFGFRTNRGMPICARHSTFNWWVTLFLFPQVWSTAMSFVMAASNCKLLEHDGNAQTAQIMICVHLVTWTMCITSNIHFCALTNLVQMGKYIRSCVRSFVRSLPCRSDKTISYLRDNS